MLTRVRCPRSAFLLARKSYSRWSFLPPVVSPSVREARPQPPPLPSPKYIDIQGRCTLEYIDLPPQEESHEAPVTFVLIHGAPGTYNDFRHLIPLLKNARVIGINLPGYAGSKVAEEHFLDDTSAVPTAKLALEAVQTLCSRQEASDKVFLVGHSFGAHTVINMAALNAKTASNTVAFRGLALLAPAGCRPHRVLRPRESAMVVQALRLGNPVINSRVPHLIKMIYTRVLLFPGELPPEHYLAGLIRAATTDFDLVREQVKMLERAQMPTFLAWSRSDEFMEKEIPEELAELCHSGPRLAFEGGGHNIQKTRAEPISTVLSEWVERVLAGDYVEDEKEATRYLS